MKNADSPHSAKTWRMYEMVFRIGHRFDLNGSFLSSRASCINLSKHDHSFQISNDDTTKRIDVVSRKIFQWILTPIQID